MDTKERKAILNKFRNGTLRKDGIGNGIRFFIKHYRLDENGQLHRYKRSGPEGYTRPFTPSTRGGETVCLLVNEKGETIATGKAICHGLQSHKVAQDAFNYKIGAHIALGRALEMLVVDREPEYDVNEMMDVAERGGPTISHP